jgi:3-oxoacyl-[acyl-carrier protein] reductase
MYMFDLTGKVAIVTGASRGIGRAISEALVRQGALVMLTDILEDAVAQAARELAAGGGKTDAAALNVTDGQSAQSLVELTLQRHGRIDLLVNNAGIARDQLLMRMKREDWDAVLNINLTGAFNCSQAVLRTMMKQRSGRIVSISSVVGQMGNAGQSNYAASKAGLIGFSKSLAREVAGRGITVNVVAPGLIDTDMTRALPDSVREEWVSKVPLARFGTPEDVASAVCFLATDEASYITGQVLAVNGGMYT